MKLHYILALLLVLAACTSTAPVADGEQASDIAQENADENSAVQQTGAEADFNKFFEQRNQEWKIAYDLKSTMDGKTTTMQTTQYLKGEDVRMDAIVEGMESRTFIVDETFTMCTKAEGEWSCFKSEPSDDDAVTSTTEWEDEYEADETKYDILADGTKAVAGVTAQCFKVVEQGNAASSVRYCFSKDGAPLYMYFSDSESTSEMIATSYSKSVSNSDFTPPAEAQDLSAMYGAGGTSPVGGDACAYCDYLSGTDRDECLASC